VRRKQQIWHFHNTIAGFTEGSGSHLPALTASAEPDVEVLPPSNNNGKSLRRINSVEERPELDEDLDDWEGKVEEDFS
jgi:hypothetical protein